MVVQKSEAKNITELLKELFKMHGFESEVYEDWVIPNGSDYAMKGIINYDKDKELTIPESYYQKIKALISNEPLDKEMHWFTFFYANLNGLDNYAEVLQENIKNIKLETKQSLLCLASIFGFEKVIVS